MTTSFIRALRALRLVHPFLVAACLMIAGHVAADAALLGLFTSPVPEHPKPAGLD